MDITIWIDTDFLPAAVGNTGAGEAESIRTRYYNGTGVARLKQRAPTGR